MYPLLDTTKSGLCKHTYGVVVFSASNLRPEKKLAGIFQERDFTGWLGSCACAPWHFIPRCNKTEKSYEITSHNKLWLACGE